MADQLGLFGAEVGALHCRRCGRRRAFAALDDMGCCLFDRADCNAGAAAESLAARRGIPRAIDVLSARARAGGF